MRRFLFLMLCCAVSLPCFASEGRHKTELTLGLLPYVSATRLIKTFLPLKKYIESHTDYDITFLTAPTFKEFIDRTQTNKYDIVFTAPHFALLAEKAGGYKRLARFSRELAACVFIAADSKVKLLADLKGRIISTPDSLAIVSVLGEFMLKEAGLSLPMDVKFLRTPSHNNVMLSVAKHSSDAGVVASTIYEQYTSKSSNKGKFKLLSCSEPIPTSMFISNSKLPQVEVETLSKILLNFSQSDEGQMFFSTTPFRGMMPINDLDMMGVEKYLDGLKARL